MGFEIQPLLVGVNVGVGVWEIVDFITGFVFIDLQDDDFGKDREDDKSEADEAEEDALDDVNEAIADLGTDWRAPDTDTDSWTNLFTIWYAQTPAGPVYDNYVDATPGFGRYQPLWDYINEKIN